MHYYAIWHGPSLIPSTCAKSGGALGTHCLRLRQDVHGDSRLFSDSSVSCDVRIRIQYSKLVRNFQLSSCTSHAWDLVSRYHSVLYPTECLPLMLVFPAPVLYYSLAFFHPPSNSKFCVSVGHGFRVNITSLQYCSNVVFTLLHSPSSS